MAPLAPKRSPLLRPILRHPKIHTLIVAVGGIGTPNPKNWMNVSSPRKERKFWVEFIPALKDPDIGLFGYFHGITPHNLSWHELLQNGATFITELHHLTQESRLGHCPILIIAHSLGGLIVKEALTLAYQERYSSLLRALAGVIFLGTPHSKAEDRAKWQKASFSVPKSPKKTRSMSDDDVMALAKSSQRFEQASVRLPILSVHETKETKVKSNIFSSKSILITTADFVKTESSLEEILAIDSDHIGLCIMDVETPQFQVICRFVQASVEDSRLRIIQGSPNFEAPSTLDGWSVVDREFSNASKSGPSTDAVARTRQPSSQATWGSPDIEFEIINPVTYNSFETAKPSILSCFSVPVTQNRNFFGREEVLRAIDEVFIPMRDSQPGIHHEPRTFALCGPGGMGKTQIAAEYVYTRRDEFKAIFWIHADSSSKVREEFSRLATHLGLIDENSSDARDYVINRDIVKGWLANPVSVTDSTHTKPTWLLVVDNLDNTDVLEDIWPLYGPGCVLFTSRDSLAKNSMLLADTGIDVPPFSQGESAGLLGKLTKKDGDSSGIHKRLGGIPLAITQMASVIIRRDLTYDEFVESYDQEGARRELFQLRFDTRNPYKKTVWSVWALESLKTSRPLLNVLSMLDPDGVPEYILTRHAASLGLPQSFPQTGAAYQRARTELFQSSLITRDSTAQRILIHRLIQDAAHAKMDAEEYNIAFQSALQLLSSVWPYESFGWRHGVQRWKVCEQLFQNILSLQRASEKLKDGENRISLDKVGTHLTLPRLFTDAGWYYHEVGFSLEAKPLLMHADEICTNLRRRLATDKQSEPMTTREEEAMTELNHITSEIHHNLGCLGTETNEPSFTLKHFKIFNEMMISESGDEVHGKDKRLSISWNELGNAYMMNKMWMKGEGCFLKSISAAQAQPNFETTDLSFPYVNLGLARWLMGQLDDAIKVLFTGLSDREKTYGLDDKQSFITGRFLYAIGNVLKSQGRLKDSFAYHTRALAQYEGTIGRHHHRTGDAHVKVAEHYLQQGVLESAEKHLQEAMGIFRDRPEFKPEKARVLYKMSQVHRAKENGAMADDTLRQAGELYNQLNSPGSDKAAESLGDQDMDDMITFWSR